MALQPVECKLATPVKREFLEISFRNIAMHLIQFPTELQNSEISPDTSLKNGSVTNTLSAILKTFGTLAGNICGGVTIYRW